MIDALRMLTGREVEAVSGTLDLSGRPDCRGEQFRDPGGWGVMRLGGGLMATLDAADYATVPATIVINGTKGRAVTGSQDVQIEYRDGRRESLPPPQQGAGTMDLCVAEIVAWLDGEGPFPCPGKEAAHTLEAIVAFHASHARQATWTALPLSGADREIEIRSG